MVSGMLRASRSVGYHAYARHHTPAPSPYQENRHKHCGCTCDQPHRASRNGHQLSPSRYDRPCIDHHPSFQHKLSGCGHHAVAPQYRVPRPQYADIPKRYHAECTCNEHAPGEHFHLVSDDYVPGRLGGGALKTQDIQHLVSEHQWRVEKALNIGKQSASVREININRSPTFTPPDIVELGEVSPKTYAKDGPVSKARTNSTTSTHSRQSTSQYRFTNSGAEENALASVATLVQDSQPLDIHSEYFSQSTPEYFDNDTPDPEYYVASPSEAVWVVHPLPGIDFVSVIRSERSDQELYASSVAGTNGFPFFHKPASIFGDNIWRRAWKNQSSNQYRSFPWADPMKTAEDKVALWDTAIINRLV